MTGFYLEKFTFFLMVDHACQIPPTPRHPARELRGLQLENHDGDSRCLA